MWPHSLLYEGDFAALCALAGYASLRRSLRAKYISRRTRRREI